MLKSSMLKRRCTRPGWRIARVGLALLVALGLASPEIARGGEPAETNCRFGLVFQGDLNGHQADYQMDQLNVGSYLDGKADTWPDLPEGAEYIPVLALRDLPEPSTPVAGWVQAHPGATWLIGDEPDNPLRDNLTAEAYAARYFALATLIRGLDPSAQLGFGGIAQPSPIRMRYLARAWDELIRLAGGSQAASGLVDIWNIHAFYLSEVQDDPSGAGIPPGFEDDAGDAYGPIESINMYDSSRFGSRLITFRMWMAEQNVREKPLWIGSYGVWINKSYISEKSASFFMTQSFTFLIDTTKRNINPSFDNNHLVQRWFWYSLNGEISSHGGSLFDPDKLRPDNLTDIGSRYFEYVPLIPLIENLQATSLKTHTIYVHGQNYLVDEQIKVTIANIGNKPTSVSVPITLWEGDPRVDGKQIGSSYLPQYLKGCGATTAITLNWSGVLPYESHVLYVEIGPAIDGNLTRFDVVTGPLQTYFPLIHGGAGGTP